MKHLLYTLAILLIAASCSNEETEQVMGQGKARLRFHVSTESPIVITRSTPVPTVNQLYVKIQDGIGAVVKQDSLKTLQQNSPVFLEAAEGGTEYKVEVFSNELKDAILINPVFLLLKHTLYYRKRPFWWSWNAVCNNFKFLLMQAMHLRRRFGQMTSCKPEIQNSN